jgi:histidinol phosphatase-like PHP family hydrolase
MRFNIHTHTFRCNHAIGDERAYIENAIKNGIEVLGFSDHSPYCFPGDYYSGFRMKKEDVSNFIKLLLDKGYNVFEYKLETLTLEEAFLKKAGGNKID